MIVFTPNTVILSADINANFSAALLDTNHINNYRFSAYLGSTQVTVNNTWTKLNFDTETYDSNSNYDTTNYRYTAPVTGYYQFTVNATLQNQAANVFLIGISKDGTNEFRRLGQNPNCTGDISLRGTADVPLTAGEYVYAIYYNSNGTKNIYSSAIYSQFSGKYIGS